MRALSQTTIGRSLPTPGVLDFGYTASSLNLGTDDRNTAAAPPFIRRACCSSSQRATSYIASTAASAPFPRAQSSGTLVCHRRCVCPTLRSKLLLFAANKPPVFGASPDVERSIGVALFALVILERRVRGVCAVPLVASASVAFAGCPAMAAAEYFCRVAIFASSCTIWADCASCTNIEQKQSSGK